MDINTTKENKRIFNFRSFSILALFLIVTIFAALITYNILMLGILFFVLILSLAIFLMIKYKKIKFKFITFIIIIIACLISYIIFLTVNHNWTDNNINGSVNLSGVVDSDVTRDGTRRIFLSNVTIDGEAFNGRVQLFVHNEDFVLEPGTIINQNVNIRSVFLVEGFDINGWAFRNNVRFTANTRSINPHTLQLGRAGFFVRVRHLIARTLIGHMGQTYGGIAYGMVTGDGAFIDGGTRDYFGAAGLAHILAVSGLHLNFATAMFAFFLTKLKLRRQIISGVSTGFIIFYALLAGLSPSVIRASIMSLVGIYVFLFGNRADSLSSLSFAASLILIFAPFFLFEIGFLYTMSAVFGIIIFTKPLSKAFKKVKIHHKIANAFALTLSVQIGIAPISIFTFHDLAIYSRFVNLIMMPFIAILFMGIIISLIFTLITGWGTLLVVMGLGIGVVDLVAMGVSTLPFALIVVYTTPAIFVLYFLYLIISKYLILPKKRLIIVFSGILCIILIFAQSPTHVAQFSIVPLESDFNTISLVKNENEVFLIGDINSGGFNIREALNQMNIRRLDAVFVNRMNYRTARNLLTINRFFNDFRVYFPFYNYDGFGLDLLSHRGIYAISVTDDKDLSGGVRGIFCDESGRFFGYEMDTKKASVLFMPFDAAYVPNMYRFDVVRAHQLSFNEYAQVQLLNRGLGYDLVFSFDRLNNYAFDFKNFREYTVRRSMR
ncbi:MAG: ComEC/Rec2 family competence protein [Firmicutes bacterium]|nr:ComEC/Rec2 family competence protein [Bacillota bacterium]